MKDPLISIVIPVYNGANYIACAIESCLRQTYRHYEIIVVDDGSTDNGETRRIVESFGPVVRYLRQEKNKGVSAALNKGIEAMSGEFFAWLSHDDLFEDRRLERVVEFMGSQVAKRGLQVEDLFVTNSYKLVDASLNTLELQQELDREFINLPWILLKGCYVNGCSSLIHRDLLSRIGLFDESLRCAQDLDYWLRAGRVASFLHVPEVLTSMRIHIGQVTSLKAAQLRSEEDAVLLRGVERLAADVDSWSGACIALLGSMRSRVALWLYLESFYRCVRCYPRTAERCKRVLEELLRTERCSKTEGVAARISPRLPRLLNLVFLSYIVERSIKVLRSGLYARLMIRTIHKR